MTDQDSPWKEMLEENLGVALDFFFPAIHTEIDWGQEHEILRQELLPVAPPGEKRIADLVAKAMSTTGDQRYLHGEVQGEEEKDFEHRIQVYNRRTADKFNQPVGSFVILTDANPDWRPDHYEAVLYGKKQTLEFHSAKVIDWLGREEELKVHSNPVALFVLAHLASTRTKKDDEARADAKVEMILLLQERFDDVVERGRWSRYLDWLLALPREYDLRVWDRVKELKKEKIMPFVTFAERYGKEKGLIEGRIEGVVKAIETVLKLRFPKAVSVLMPRLLEVKDVDRVQHLLEVALTASLDEIETAIEAAVPSPK